MLDHAEKKPPFLKLLPVFCAGIVWGWYATPQVNTVAVMIAAGFCFLLLLQLKKWNIRTGKQMGPLAVYLLLAGCGGWITMIQKTRLLPETDTENLLRKEQTMLMQVTEEVVETEKSFKLSCTILGSVEKQLSSFENEEPEEAHNLKKITASARQKIIVYLRKNDSAAPAGYGSRILAVCKPKRIRSSGNPGSFDYAGWAAKKGICLQAWTDTGSFEVLPGFHGNKCQRLLYELRKNILSSIDRYVPDPSTAGIAKALLIGYRHGIDDELNDAYIRTGVVHIVAISGMHLNMIFGLLAFLPFGKGSRATWITRNVFIATVIWVFTILTGGAASIVRAAVMLSIVLFAECMVKRSGSLNILLAAAFIMLAADPMTLWDIGFQLSFAAVGGLILFAQPLTALLQPKHPLLQIMWQMQAVNIAAQVLTTPLVLFYFHQFPLLFLLTNMVAVPVSGLVLYIEIGCCLLLWCSPLATITGSIIHQLLAYMNKYIEAIASIPFCTAEKLLVSEAQVAWMYVFTACTAWWLAKKNMNGLKGGMVALLVLFMLRSKSIDVAGKQSGLHVYQLPNHLYAEGINGRTAFRINTGTTQNEPDGRLFRKHILPAHVLKRIVRNDTKDLFIMKGKAEVHITGWIGFVQMQEHKFPETRRIFIVLVEAARPVPHLKTLPSLVILGGNISSYHSSVWRKYCRENQVALHEVKREGAFVIPLN